MELLVAGLIGYLVAYLGQRINHWGLDYGARIIRQEQEACQRGMTESFDQLFDGGPIDLEVQPDRLSLTYQSSRCPGPHGVYYPTEAVEARKALANYLAERIVASRFSRIRIHW